MLRTQISRWQQGGLRETKLHELLPANVSESAVESALDWIYVGMLSSPKGGIAPAAPLPSASSSPLVPPRRPSVVTADPSAGIDLVAALNEMASPGSGRYATRADPGCTGFHSARLTSPELACPPWCGSPSRGSRRTSFCSVDGGGAGGPHATCHEVELWLVADVLDIQGLKSRLLPLFESLPQLQRYYTFMEPGAVETLGLLDHACDLGCTKIGAALCVNLRVRVHNEEVSVQVWSSTPCTFAIHTPPANPRLSPTCLPACVAQTLREYIVPLYLAACLCDASLRERYGAAIDALSLQELCRLLDADTLRCDCEDQVSFASESQPPRWSPDADRCSVPLLDAGRSPSSSLASSERGRRPLLVQQTRLIPRRHRLRSPPPSSAACGQCVASSSSRVRSCTSSRARRTCRTTRWRTR